MIYYELFILLHIVYDALYIIYSVDHGYLCTGGDWCWVIGHRPLFHKSTTSLAPERSPPRQCVQGLQISTKPQSKPQHNFTHLFLCQTLSSYTLHFTLSLTSLNSLLYYFVYMFQLLLHHHCPQCHITLGLFSLLQFIPQHLFLLPPNQENLKLARIFRSPLEIYPTQPCGSQVSITSGGILQELDRNGIRVKTTCAVHIVIKCIW